MSNTDKCLYTESIIKTIRVYIFDASPLLPKYFSAGGLALAFKISPFCP